MIEKLKNKIEEETGFIVMNDEKLNRAVFGTVGREGKLNGGVGEDAESLAILTEYDRLGGLIKKGKQNVKIGSFYDFEDRKPRTEPEITLIFRDLEGEVVEIAEGDAVPVEVQAAEIAAEKRRKKALAAQEEKDKKREEHKAKNRRGKVDEE